MWNSIYLGMNSTIKKNDYTYKCQTNCLHCLTSGVTIISCTVVQPVKNAKVSKKKVSIEWGLFGHEFKWSRLHIDCAWQSWGDLFLFVSFVHSFSILTLKSLMPFQTFTNSLIYLHVDKKMQKNKKVCNILKCTKQQMLPKCFTATSGVCG